MPVGYMPELTRIAPAPVEDVLFYGRDLLDAVRLVPYGELAAACRALVDDGQARRELAARGFQRMSARNEAAILQRVLGKEKNLS